MLTVGSLFSGIGGFELGLERAGMRVIWQAEIDPYAAAVLRKHWPGVPNHGDVRSIRAGYVERPDVLCGGFPCQDISNAGKREGIDGERSGLWSEFARIIGELRPRYVIVENVAAMLGRGIERVLGDLAALGFDAEWHCIPAAAVGAPHRRDRVWILAYSARNEHRPGDGEIRRPRERALASDSLRGGIEQDDAQRGALADANDGRCEVDRIAQHGDEQGAPGRQPDGCGTGRRGNGAQSQAATWDADAGNQDAAWANVADSCQFGPQEWGWLAGMVCESSIHDARARVERNGWWLTEPDVGRVAHGVPARVDRLRCLGNAIVPQVAEIIGRAIVSAHE